MPAGSRGAIREKVDVVLVAGILFGTGKAYAAAVRNLEKEWGPVDEAGEILPFNFTNYYDEEMGPCLRKRFIAFGIPFDAGSLRDAKLRTIEIERKLAEQGRRTVNIDPGYLDLSKLVVATTKDATYRVYLGGGIYAQPMLRYERQSYRPWPWTYPDYQTQAALAFFNKTREKHKTGGILRTAVC